VKSQIKRRLFRRPDLGLSYFGRCIYAILAVQGLSLYSIDLSSPLWSKGSVNSYVKFWGALWKSSIQRAFKTVEQIYILVFFYKWDIYVEHNDKKQHRETGLVFKKLLKSKSCSNSKCQLQKFSCTSLRQAWLLKLAVLIFGQYDPVKH